MFKVLIFSFVFIIIILPNNIYAQRNVGKLDKSNNIAEKDILDFTVKEWIGKQFIFLEQPISLQQYGYELRLSKNLNLSCNSSELENKTTCNLKYDKFSGKKIKAINIEENNSDYLVTFLDEESNTKIYGTPYMGCITGIAFFSDLENAKKRWLGKLIYSKKRSIRTYDEILDAYGELKIKIGESLEVQDVWWGFSSGWPTFANKEGPLWLIVKTSNGEKGFIPTAFSWSNIYEDRWVESRPWEDDFFEFNPKKKYAWSSEIWKLIDNGKVRIGMNKEQVKLSFGNPKKVNEIILKNLIHEQWIYGSQYLYFDNDKLTAIQSY